MLPETIPFIAELMEDDNIHGTFVVESVSPTRSLTSRCICAVAAVEKLCQSTIKLIEELSGESLDTYLR